MKILAQKFHLQIILLLALTQFANGNIGFFDKVLFLEGAINSYSNLFIVEDVGRAIQEYNEEYHHSNESSEYEPFNLLRWFESSFHTFHNLSRIDRQLRGFRNNRLKAVIFLPETQESFDLAVTWVQQYIESGKLIQNTKIFLQWTEILNSEEEIDPNAIEVPEYFGLYASFFLVYRISMEDVLDAFNSIDEETRNGTRYVFWEFYWFKGIFFSKKLDFDPENMTLDDFPRLAKHRSDVGGATIKALALDGAIEEEIATFTNESGTIQFDKGLGSIIMKDLANIMNFSLEPIAKSLSEAWTNGVFDPFTFILKGHQPLFNGEADISISSYFQPSFQKLSKLVPVRKVPFYAFFRQPPASDIRDIYINPLKWNLWIAFGGTWTLVFISISIFILVENNLFVEDEEWSISEGFLCIWGIACQQSWYKAIKTIPKRLIFLSSYITSNVSYFAYTAAILTILTSENTPIKNLDDLRNSDLSLLVSPFEREFVLLLGDANFRVSEDSSKYIEHGEENFIRLILTEDSMLMSTRIRVGNHFRLIYDNNTDTEHPERIFCDKIYEIPLSPYKNTNMFHVQKNSPLKELFNFYIQRLLERGLIGRTNVDELKSAIECDARSRNIYRQQFLGLNDVFTAFVILLSGYLISGSILVAELFYWKGKQKRIGFPLNTWIYPKEFSANLDRKDFKMK